MIGRFPRFFSPFAAADHVLYGLIRRWIVDSVKVKRIDLLFPCLAPESRPDLPVLDPCVFALPCSAHFDSRPFSFLDRLIPPVGLTSASGLTPFDCQEGTGPAVRYVTVSVSSGSSLTDIFPVPPLPDPPFISVLSRAPFCPFTLNPVC